MAHAPSLTGANQATHNRHSQAKDANRRPDCVCWTRPVRCSTRSGPDRGCQLQPRSAPVHEWLLRCASDNEVTGHDVLMDIAPEEVAAWLRRSGELDPVDRTRPGHDLGRRN